MTVDKFDAGFSQFSIAVLLPHAVVVRVAVNEPALAPQLQREIFANDQTSAYLGIASE
jgi:hypothetical protein